jgi:peptidoglycan hydrolase-like protein with peptidoglycan-binding domain
MSSITKAVGRGVSNTNKTDVELVQKLLNRHRLPSAKALKEDGLVGPKTIEAIEEFQRRVVKMSKPDGRVDPGGGTFLALSAGGGLPAAPASPSAPAGNATVVYKNTLSSGEKIVHQYSFDVIKMVMNNAGCSKGVITSTIRTPEEQVDIMYRNAKVDLAGQYDLYGSTGDAVLKVYANNKQKPEAEVKKLMVEKAKQLLDAGQRVSLHVTTPANYKLKNIIDIGVNSTKAAAGNTFDKAKITAAFKKAEKDGYINKFIDETAKSNNCWHVEIVPNAKALP